jgi:hypothetical protein
MTTVTCLLATVLAVLTIPLMILWWAAESREQRCKRLRRQGWTQQRIADHLSVSRSTVRRILTA